MLVSRTKAELVCMASCTFKHKSVGQQLLGTLNVIKTLSISDVALKLLACDVPAAGFQSTRACESLGR